MLVVIRDLAMTLVFVMVLLGICGVGMVITLEQLGSSEKVETFTWEFGEACLATGNVIVQGPKCVENDSIAVRGL